jgi:hypothetical protein
MKKKLKKLLLALITWCLIIAGCQKIPDTETTPQRSEPNSLVPISLAREVAKSFDETRFINTTKNKTVRKELTGNNTIASELTFKDKNGQPSLYVFNYPNNLGYVFVSADYNLRPVLAFIDNGEFKNANLPEGLQMWINRTTENVEVVRAGLYDNRKEGSLAWNRYIKEYKVNTSVLQKPAPIDPDPCNPIPPPSTYTVGPLLPVTWGQACSYNDLCNLSVNYSCFGCNTRPATGCVATAMAQVMRHHQFPANYNYASMPAGSGNVEVQRLMRDAGVSVGMSYGCSSSAYGSNIVPALKNTFGYGSANRWGYSTVNGYSRVKNNVSWGWPVLLEGHDASAGGHEWVCDGWSETTYYICEGGIYSITYLNFHMNWGWHETWGGTDYNGWFAFDNWNIWGLNWNFQYNRYAITEIHP